MSDHLRQKWGALQNNLRHHARVLIAFSGGCDSSFLLATAVKVLGRENVLGVTAISASLPSHEKGFTRELARQWNARYLAIETEELANPSYATNPSNRCFFCKDELYEKLTPIAQEHHMVVADGFNVSDRADYRPGYQASQKWQVVHPLDVACLTKSDIRTLSRWLGLPTWNKPASPCLSSRIPYGMAVTEKILRQIERAEKAVRAEGFNVVRVRHFGQTARVEVPLKDLARLEAPNRWPKIVQNIQACGYLIVQADPRGYESGRLNARAG